MNENNLKSMMINETVDQLKNAEKIDVDKSIMIKLTPEEILNLATMCAKYWENAKNANTPNSVEEVCKFHLDVNLGILEVTDPDRFERNK